MARPDSGSGPAGNVPRRRNRSGNLRRYVHTGSFNRLAGRSTAPGRIRRKPPTLLWKIVFLILGGAFLALGFAGILF